VTALLFRDDAYLRTCTAEVIDAGSGGVQLSRTVFYPAGGGQPGDLGRLRIGSAELQVIDTVKAGDGVLHLLEGGAAPPGAGSPVEAEIDWERRHRLMRMHSALHLLCAAVAQPVTGGQIGDGKGRLDFDVQDGPLDKERILERLQGWIEGEHAIGSRWIDADELERRPELVRTMSVRPPSTGGRIRLVEIEGVDLQACGGTHVRSTGEIGRVLVGKIENKGRQNRRVNLLLA
jgi:misacylated tRNA(Ala) deacylase